MRIDDWTPQHRGGSLHVAGWFRTYGGDVIRVASGRIVETRTAVGRKVRSYGGVGGVEDSMAEGGIVRDGIGRRYFLGHRAA
jgi:hypothetical protein